METVGLCALAFGAISMMFALWFAERKTPHTPIPDDESLPRPPGWGSERTGPLWRGDRTDDNPYVVRMAEAIERHRLAQDDRRLSPRSGLRSGLAETNAFEEMLGIRREYWLVARAGVSSHSMRSDRVAVRLGRMIDDEINRPLREHEAADAAQEKAKIEDASILKDRGTQAIVDFAPEGGLVRISTAHHGIVHFLRVHNGTVNPDGSREEYAICVPNECRTVKAALAWTYGIEPEAYEEVVRT